jgi:two-component sensor histidine kinase
MHGLLQDRSAEFSAPRIAVLESIARNDPIDATLAELCRQTERLIPDAIAGVCILDRAARVFEDAFFPSLAPTFAKSIAGARVAQQPGSCAVAIYKGVIVTSTDIASDKRFRDEWCALNLQHEIRSIQSRPVFSPDGTSLGTFVLGFRLPRELVDFDEDVAAMATQLTGLVLTRYREQQKQVLLIGELRHRTRNIFATIGAVVYSTLRSNPDLATFRKVFDGRLSALSRAQSVAIDDSDTDLRALLLDVLAPYGGEQRVEITGPPIRLSQEAAAAFALAANELATNATKHGALSNADGKIHVTWNVSKDAQLDSMFELRWSEHDGPPVQKPTRAGFGSKAITQSLGRAIDGVVELDFPPQGLTCAIRAPVTDRLGAPQA